MISSWAHAREVALRLTQPFFVINAAVVLAYPVLRAAGVIPVGSLRDSTTTWTGFSRELEVAMLVATASFARLRRCVSAEELAEKALFHGKVGIAVLLWYAQGWPLTLAYLAAAVLLALLVPPPRAVGGGGGGAHVMDLDVDSFDARVRRPEGGGKGFFLVCFYAGWCESTTHFRPIFQRLARAHGAAGHVRFGEMDVAVAADVAEEYSIDTGGLSRQLPTVILFSGEGNELARLPPFGEDGKVKRVRLEEKTVTRYFGLDRSREELERAWLGKRGGKGGRGAKGKKG